MKRLAIALTAIGLLAAPTVAGAGGPKGCPPGLAKKHNGCMPPGQAKKQARYDDHRYDDDEHHHRDDDHYHDGDRDHVRVYRRGDHYDGDYVVIRDYDRWGLERPDDRYAYWGNEDRIYRVNPETREIIDIIRLANAVFN